MKCASRRTSAAEKFSSSRHFGMSACICSANLVASPSDSRCASCCGISGMAFAADYAGIPQSLAALAAFLHAFGEPVQNPDRIVPSEAAVGHALAVFERLPRHDLLAPFDEVRLDHHADDA